MKTESKVLLIAAGFAALMGGATAQSDSIDFGDDKSIFAKDGECDDARFIGDLSSATFDPADIKHDATDCRAAYDSGYIRLREADDPEPASVDDQDALNNLLSEYFGLFDTLAEDADPSEFDAPPEDGVMYDGINFGDDAGDWAYDGECDDPRFAGEGSAGEPLLAVDAYHDADDCLAAYKAGKLDLIVGADAFGGGMSTIEIDFGDDLSQWANDEECDDSRFIGAGMTGTALVDEDIGHDASDCEAAYLDGTIRLRTANDPQPVSEEVIGESMDHSDHEPGPAEAADYDAPPADGIIFNGVNFGDNSSTWANDGECDDPRFKGVGQTETILLATDAYHDADDCLAAWRQGGLELID